MDFSAKRSIYLRTSILYLGCIFKAAVISKHLILKCPSSLLGLFSFFCTKFCNVAAKYLLFSVHSDNFHQSCFLLRLMCNISKWSRPVSAARTADLNQWNSNLTKLNLKAFIRFTNVWLIFGSSLYVDQPISMASLGTKQMSWRMNGKYHFILFHSIEEEAQVWGEGRWGTPVSH